MPAASAFSASPDRDVVHDQRMQVAVPGVEDIGDAQAVALHDGVHARQHLGQAAVGIVPSMQM